MNVLICSQQGEVQVEEVSQQLKTLGANPVLFERYRKDQFISYHYSPSATAILHIDNEEYPLNSETFPVVWYRPKPIISAEMPGEMASIIEKFCFQEWRVILQSLEMFLDKSKWINPMLNSQKASNKPYQLKLASDIGLKIPCTTITNYGSKVLALFEDQKRVVYKTLSSFFTAEKTIYTNEIFPDQVMNCDEGIAMAPGIFQRYVEKQHELRVTVIGKKIFVTQINSQEKQQSVIDWRRGHDQTLCELGELSKKTKNKLLCLHERLGLVYAAYDFIVSNKGQEIFVECNPSGQWLWLEKFLNLNMSEAMAREMISC